MRVGTPRRPGLYCRGLNGASRGHGNTTGNSGQRGGASIEVSGAWARWLTAHGPRCARIAMLPGSRVIEVTRFYSDAAAFDRDLRDAVAKANAATATGTARIPTARRKTRRSGKKILLKKTPKP